MENCVSINLRKEEIFIKIADQATHEEAMECLKEKIAELKKMYKEEKFPIRVGGKVLKQKEMEEIESLITEKINVPISFETSTEMGLSEIKKTYERNTEYSETRFYKGSLRSGQKLEEEGSIVIIGDVNAGAEVIAGENIVIIGMLRGLAHAGAKGNTKAVISASSIDTTQLRIANLVKEMEKEEQVDRKYTYVSVQDKEIVIE